jgi:hypothetical protein
MSGAAVLLLRKERGIRRMLHTAQKPLQPSFRGSLVSVESWQGSRVSAVLVRQGFALSIVIDFRISLLRAAC